MNILMVCLGNICRSPLAEGILRDRIKKYNLDWHVDSAGTGSWHVGHLPDRRSIEVARENGIDITYQRARQFSSADFSQFDLILAMDQMNLRDIANMAPNVESKGKVQTILGFIGETNDQNVPDPYYTGKFEQVFDLLENACDELIKKLAVTMV